MSDSIPKILLLHPSCFYGSGWAARLELKTSMLLLASYLAQYFPVTFEDFEISIGTPNSAAQIRRFERRARMHFAENQCDILAISCWTSLSYQSTMSVARIFREMHPDKLIVVGGYHPSAIPGDFMTPDNTIDYVIRGEGEHSLREIAEGFSKSGRPDKTTIVTSPTLAADEFVEYNWDLADGFVNRHFPDGLPNVFMYVSRGCPFCCSFCMEPLKDRAWRAFSPEKSIEQILAAVDRYGARAVALSDACFGMRPAWRKEFLERLVEIDPSFWIVVETRPEYIDEEDAKLMSKLRIEIQLGIESCAQDMLLLMKKSKSPQKFLQKFKETSHLLSEHGVLHRANLIMNYPGETRRTLRETYDFIDDELKRSDSYLMWAMSEYMHFPGCELFSDSPRFESEYGSRFLGGEWWKKPEAQFDNTVRNIPSADLDGPDIGLWSQMYQERQEGMKAALAPEAFKFAASKYFAEWRNDPRYSQS